MPPEPKWHALCKVLYCGGGEWAKRLEKIETEKIMDPFYQQQKKNSSDLLIGSAVTVALTLLIGCGDINDESCLDDLCTENLELASEVSSIEMTCEQGEARKILCGVKNQEIQMQVCIDGEWEADGTCFELDDLVLTDSEINIPGMEQFNSELNVNPAALPQLANK